MALILDGTSPTGAWSMFRDLLTSFIGGTRYTTSTGINSWKDQSGNLRHLGSSGSAEPSVTTAGPLSRTCADFDGVDDFMQSAVGLFSFISNSTGYIVVSFIADAVTLNNANSYDNNPIFGTASDYMGLFLKNTGTPATILAYNYDGTDDHANIASAITTGTVYVAEWRHEGGSLYVRLNGGTEVSVASGNTAANPIWSVGTSNITRFGNIKIFEMATFSTVPALATRDAIVADFMAQHVGPTDARVTQTLAEHWLTTNPQAQITQVVAEHWASVASGNLQAVVTQVMLEHWTSVAVVVPAAGGPQVTMIH